MGFNNKIPHILKMYKQKYFILEGFFALCIVYIIYNKNWNYMVEIMFCHASIKSG